MAVKRSRLASVISPTTPSNKGVSAATGQSALTRMFLAASSAAIVSVRLHAAAFEALYQAAPALGRNPATDAVLMIDPPPLAARCGMAARLVSSQLLTLTLKILA